MECIEKRKTKEFFIVTNKSYKKAIQWLFDIYGKELKILNHWIDRGLVNIKYEVKGHTQVLKLPMEDVAIFDKEDKRIFSKDQKNFLKEFRILS